MAGIKFRGAPARCCVTTVPCAQCTGGVASPNLDITLGTFIAANGLCNNCLALNGLKVTLPYLGDDGTNCNWGLDITPSGGSCSYRVRANFTHTGFFAASIFNLGDATSGIHWAFTSAVSLPYDCTTIRVTVPYSSNHFGGADCTDVGSIPSVTLTSA